MKEVETIRGRGAVSNPGNRFERTEYAVSEWDDPDDPSRPQPAGHSRPRVVE